MWAGDLTMRVGNAADYGKVDASVRAGDLDMGPFGVSKSGLFRSYETTGTVPIACTCMSRRAMWN